MLYFSAAMSRLPKFRLPRLSCSLLFPPVCLNSYRKEKNKVTEFEESPRNIQMFICLKKECFMIVCVLLCNNTAGKTVVLSTVNCESPTETERLFPGPNPNTNI